MDMTKKYLIFVFLITLLFSTRFSFASRPSDFGLKEGDLISAIFSDDPDVYIINEQGYKRLFLNPEIFKFYTHLGGFANIKLVTPEVRDSFPTSGFFRNCEDNDQKVFGTSVEGEDMGRLHWINKSGDQAVQEDPDFFKKVFCINRKEFNWYPRGNEFKALREVPQYNRSVEVENPVICHHPSSDPKTFQTVRVAPEALDAHFQHGDTKGACPGFLVPTPKPEIVTPTPTPITGIYLIKPMVLKDILKIESVIPYDVANLSFGVYQVSAQYNLGGYHQGKWYEGLNPGILEPVWVEFGWPNTAQVDIVLFDENDQQRKIYLPATGSNKNPDGSVSNWYYWISEDGSSYYGRKDHNYGWPDLSSVEALRPEHLARKAGVSVPTSTPTPTPTPISTSTFDLSVIDVIPNPAIPEANKDFTVDVVFKNVGQKPITNPTAGLNIYDPNGKIIYSPATGYIGIVDPGATITVKFYSDMFSPRLTETTLNYPAGIYKMVGNINYLGVVDGINYPKDPYPNNDTFTKMLEIKSTAVSTPTPTPTTMTLTIRGRMVNAVTNQPVTSTNMLIWNWKGSTRRDFYLKSNGMFEIQLTEDDIANASATYVNNVHINSQACYDQSQFSIQKTSTGSVDYVRVQGPGGNYSGISTRTVQPINNVADIGDFLVWPVTGFSLVSDIPVKFTSKFANGSGGGGNSLYKTSHGFSTLYPINTGTSIILTDQFGKQYASSYVKYSLGQHCSQVTLNFASVASSQFLWSPSGETATANPNSSFASNTFTRDLYFGLTGIDIKQLQALLVNEVGYSADLITGYFGRITKDAVKRLQEKYGIKPVSGYFGSITRKVLNALISD